MNNTCALCGRQFGEIISIHHLIPVSCGGKDRPTVNLHPICHKAIHAMFSEKMLAREYNTIAKLLAVQSVQNFVRFVSKKEPNYFATSRESNHRGREFRRKK